MHVSSWLLSCLIRCLFEPMCDLPFSPTKMQFLTLCLLSAASAKLMAEAIMLPDVNTTIGKTITGKVSFAQESQVDKVQITFSFKGLLPDTTHGIHIHGAPITNQNCTTAGGHFNPLNTTHGDRLSSRENRHVGDLGNSVANAKGEIEITFSDELVTLFGPLNVTSFGFVIHEKVDDLGMGNTNKVTRKSIGLWKYSIGFRCTYFR